MKKYSLLLSAIGFYWLAAFLDYGSSMWSGYTSDAIESNPWVRNQDLGFVLHKALVVDILYFLLTAAIAYFIYKIAKVYSPRWAKILTPLIFIYRGYERIHDAVITNFLFAWHFYVPDPTFSEVIKHIGK